MNEFNTFTGKTVDDAISEACRFFATERDKLVVEIVSGGSTGIFGLMGKKRAEIKARRRQDPATGMENAESGENRESGAAQSANGRAADRERSRKPRGAKPAKPQPAAKPKEEVPAQKRETPVIPPKVPAETLAQAPAETVFAEDDQQESPGNESRDDSPASPELLDMAKQIVTGLLAPILGETPALEASGTASRVNVVIADEKHSGLLIGREGQTLAALQYLANRILARRFESPARIRLNTGEYREKQDDNLRKLALFLADKAKNLGRAQSTRPLSSYHRRVIHMTLQDDETVQTHSKGEGAMKRVIITPKR